MTQLTKRQRQIVEGIARCDPRHRIASDLGISIHTLDHTITAIRKKLGIRGESGDAKLIAWAIQHGI